MLTIRSAKNRLFGFIDYHGEVVIQPRFHDVAPFAGLGLAAARITNDREGAFGYIDREGNVVIGPSFFSAHNFTSQGIALVVFDRRRDFCTALLMRKAARWSHPFSNMPTRSTSSAVP